MLSYYPLFCTRSPCTFVRLLRHFSLLGLVEFESPTLVRIFNTIVEWYFGSQKFDRGVAKTASSVVSATLQIYTEARKHLLQYVWMQLVRQAHGSKLVLGFPHSARQS